LDEALLLALGGVPRCSDRGERGELRPGDRRQGHARPTREPDAVGAVEVSEHASDGWIAELLADVARGELLAQRGRHVVEAAIGPAMVVVQPTDQLEAH